MQEVSYGLTKAAFSLLWAQYKKDEGVMGMVRPLSVIQLFITMQATNFRFSRLTGS